MKTINEYFQDYQDSHHTTGNQITHFIGIPMILIGLLGLLARLSYSYRGVAIDAAQVVAIATLLLFYARLHIKMAVAMAIALSLMYLGGRAAYTYLPPTIALAVLGGLFVVGWGFQFLGHSVYEKKQPAFFSNLTHLLVGPMWIVNKLVKVVQFTPQTAES